MINLIDRRKVIVIGCGRLGSNIATKLSLEGENVIILDENLNAFRKLDDNFSGYSMSGNGSDLETLENAGIKDAKIIVITTENDNVNLYIAQLASLIYKVEQIYVRLNDTNKSILLENTNVKGIFPFDLSMKEFDRIRNEENQ